MNRYATSAILIGACGSISFFVGTMLFPRFRQRPTRVTSEISAGAMACPPEAGSSQAAFNRSAVARANELKVSLAALSQIPLVEPNHEATNPGNVEVVSPFQRLTLEDQASAMRLRSGLSEVVAKETGAIWACVGHHQLPVSTFVEIAWTVRPSGDGLLATDGRFEGVRRGAALPAAVLSCLAAMRFSARTFNVPGLRLRPDFHSRITTTFLLAVDPRR
jgi:hypothetical protein